tara:strand:- start:400 stop:594 length:195 start_codon:yes stop_codon:yes gene_type:complete
MYIHHNKTKDTYQIYTALTTLSKEEGIPYETLRHHFTKLKAERYDRTLKPEGLIIKNEPIKIKR